MKAGYKQTEVGVIPEDWDACQIGEISVVSSGGTPSRKVDAYWNGGIPWVTTSEVDYFLIEETAQNISKLGLENSAAKIFPPETILLALYGQGKTRGKVGILGVSAATNQACASIEIISQDSYKFLFYYLAFKYEDIRKLSNNGNQENLSGFLVRSIKIPRPAAAEQQAIASALSDADELIESLEQLLAKKRNLKQGAMQELLTGKRRLAGFGAPWNRRKLGELLTIRHGKSQHHVESSDGTYPILATGGQIGWAADFLYDKSSVLIGRKGTIDKPQYMNSPFWTVDTLFYSEIADGNSAKFLYYRFCLIDWKQHNEASGVPSLSAKTIENIEILCPESDEQTAIAAILSDMDADITALETQLTKARQIKQGMMQELLTGRIRLV